MDNDEQISARRDNVTVKWNKSLRFRLTVIVVLVSLFWGIAVIVSVGYLYQNRIASEYTRTTVELSKIVASMVSGEMIDHYLSTLEKDDEYYRVSDLLKVLQQETGVMYIYISRPFEDGEIFIFDTDQEHHFDLGEKEIWSEDNYDLAILPHLINGERVAPDISTTRWGWLLTVHEPITRADGSVAGYANIDTSLTKLMQERNAALLVLIPVIAVILFVSFAANFYTIQRLVISPVRLLVKAVSAYNPGLAQPDLLERAKLKPGFEFSVLEHSIIDMQARIESMLDDVKKAFFDALTGVHNRRYFDENIDNLIKSQSRSGSLLSLMMIDIDYFKKYNDSYGHSEGDICLKRVAETLAKSMQRKEDYVARYGGEEFVVVLPNTNEEGARKVAEKLLKNVRDCKIPHEKSDVSPNVSVSIGVTTGKADYMQKGDDYIRRADEMLYKSKNGGRNRFEFQSLAENQPDASENT